MKEKKLSRFVDLIFFLGALSSFGAFGYFSMVGAPISSGEAVALLKLGEADRKSARALTFQSISKGAKLFHRDALWIEKGQSASISFNDGTVIYVEEQTFLVIERQLNGAEEVKVITGGVTIQVQGTKPIKIETANEDPNASAANAPNTPAPRSSVSPVPIDPAIYPKPGTKILLANGKPEHEVAFSWGKSTASVLQVLSGGKEVARINVQGKTFARVRLKTAVTYSWQLLDTSASTNTVVIQQGPYNFSINPLKLDQLNMGSSANPDEPIEIIH